ncbi:MAG: GatB/YqeY domain-containing protein [Coprobacillus sp.]|nr:GatB/YqeY domain-containing protein [Coprobacillus sp.]
MLIDELKKANIEAMKAHDSDARSIISVVLTREKTLELDLHEKGEEVKDSDVLSIISKVLKELDEEKEGYEKVGNSERVNGITHQIEVISSYLPSQLSEDEILKIINSLDDKSVPSVMKYFKANYAGSVDMSLVSKLLKSIQ